MFDFLKTKKEKSASDHLISSAYLARISEEHATDPSWGTTGEHYLEIVVDAITTIDARSVLDYGCGKGNLRQAIFDVFDDVVVYGYDPAITRFAEVPTEPFDLVTCTNVIEHVEPEKIDAVLKHISSLTEKAALFVIDTKPEGRNVHETQRPVDWWFQKLATHFHFEKITPLGEFAFVATCRPWSLEIINGLLATAQPISAEQIEQKLREDAARVERADFLSSFHFEGKFR